jgi:hypothetical protein
MKCECFYAFRPSFQNARLQNSYQELASFVNKGSSLEHSQALLHNDCAWVSASPGGTETKGKVEMASYRLAVSNVNRNRIKRNPFLYTIATTLFTTSIWNTKHAFLRASPTLGAQLSFKKKRKNVSVAASAVCCQLQHTTPTTAPIESSVKTSFILTSLFLYRLI